MDLSHITPTLAIEPGQPLRVEDGLGQRYVVVTGDIWVTQDRDPRDRVFAPGEDFLIDRAGLAVFSALEGKAATVARLA